MTNNRTSELRAELVEALSRDSVDFSQVLTLATELAKSDPDNVRFFTDAGIIRRLGYELVSRQETAVSELVKNAYDADAKIVDLIFSNADEPGGTLEILDDGVGMTRDDLVNGFMRLSSLAKVHEPISPRYKRQRAGRKGIGRFAVQRLGSQLTITTQTKGTDRALRVRIDWDQFVPGQELTAISSRIEEVVKIREEGTCLFIENLRDSWSEAQMRRVWRYVSDLLQPLPLSITTDSADQDPGFRAEFYQVQDGELETVADEQTEIFKFAVAQIDGAVNSRGLGMWSIDSVRFPQINDHQIPIGADPDDPSVPFKYLQNVRLRAYYFIYQSGLLPTMMDKLIRSIADEWGGIRLYRNGFRVLPYGENQDDWLNLDKATSRRQILPPFSNLNFFGFVEIIDPNGEHFEETASREGLIENEAFHELSEFAFRVLRAAVLRVAEARNVKLVTTGRQAQIEAPPEEKIEKALSELRVIVNSKGEEEYLVEAVIEDLTEGFQELRLQQASLIDELGMLRVLASLGIVIGEFTHEIGHTLLASTLHARNLTQLIREPPSAIELAGNLDTNIQRISAYAQYFDTTVRANTQRQLKPQELGSVALAFQREMKPSTQRRGIQIEVEVKGFDIYTTPMHTSELASILFNFYSNSLKAIRRVRREQGYILIRCGQNNNKVFIEFCDNGDGIPEELRERIFNPFFTTTTYGGDDPDDDLRGTGLGLKIVKDIVSGYDGHVYVKQPPNDFATCFRVDLPKATSDELADYDL